MMKKLSGSVEFYNYISRHPVLWMCVLLYAVISHGSILLSSSVGIDTEVFINGQEQNWLGIGRQGLVLTKYLLGNGHFNPLYAGSASLLFLTLCCMLWSFFYEKAAGGKEDHPVASLLFSFALLSSGILTLQTYFKLQILEISFCLCLMAINLLLLFHAVEEEKMARLCGLFAVVLVNLVLFSAYQIFAILFVFGVVSRLVTAIVFGEFGTLSARKQWAIVWITAAVFVVSMGLNLLISKLFFMDGGGYLSGQVLWHSQSVGESLYRIFRHMGACLIGLRLYYSAALLMYDVLLFLAAVVCLKKGIGKSEKMILCLSLLMIMISPFIITFLLAQTPQARGQLILPFALAFGALFLSLHKVRARGLFYAGILVSVFCITTQFQVTQRMNYTDMVRYAGDVRLAESIRCRLQQMGYGDDCTIAFVGHREAQLNDACIEVEALSFSFFDWDYDVEPRYSHSTSRIVGFLNTQGGHYTVPPADFFMDKRWAVANEMACWPGQDSIRNVNDVVIVKLSED